MAKGRVTTADIRDVDRLAGKGLSIKQACIEVGISPAIYHRHTALRRRFPALDRDWDALTESYRPNFPPEIRRQLTEGDLLDLAYSVGRLFERSYGLPAPVATARQLQTELRPFAGSLSRLVALYRNLGADARERANAVAMLAARDFEFDLAEIMDVLAPLSAGFADALTAATEGSSQRGRGGRAFDTRPRAIAAPLGTLFAKTARQAPAAWRKRNDSLGDAFSVFAQHAFRHFLGLDPEELEDHAIREAIVWVAQHIDHTDEAAGHDAILSDD